MRLMPSEPGLKPGLTPLHCSCKHLAIPPFFPLSEVMGMNWNYIGAGAICILIGLQFALADMISTSISCDGVTLLS